MSSGRFQNLPGPKLETTQHPGSPAHGLPQGQTRHFTRTFSTYFFSTVGKRRAPGHSSLAPLRLLKGGRRRRPLPPERQTPKAKGRVVEASGKGRRSVRLPPRPRQVAAAAASPDPFFFPAISCSRFYFPTVVWIGPPLVICIYPSGRRNLRSARRGFALEKFRTARRLVRSAPVAAVRGSCCFLQEERGGDGME